MTDLQKRLERDRLVELLTVAAELEHALCCQYLFAAFSLKGPEEGLTHRQLELVRGWKSTLYMIARQEMVHLATVNNLLTAIGEAPYFGRADFPTTDRHLPHGVELHLRPFDLQFVEDSLRFEEPPDEDPEFELGNLYAEVEKLFESLGRDGKALLIGPREAQIDNSIMLPSYPHTDRALRRPMWDMLIRKVLTMEDVLAAIRQVRDEGEGISGAVDAAGHFQMFEKMRDDFVTELQANVAFRPSRPVVMNPWSLKPTGVAPGVVPGNHHLKFQPAIDMADTFNLAYEIMLRMMILFFTQNPLSRSGFRAIQHVVFLPLMALVIRPLGEFLTYLPADDPGEEDRAGAPFRVPRRVAQLPHAEAAWRVLDGQLAQLHEQVNELKGRTGLPSWMPPRLETLAENTWRIRADFTRLIGVP